MASPPKPDKTVEDLFSDIFISPFEIDFGDAKLKFNTVKHMLLMMKINVIPEFGKEAFYLSLNSKSKISRLDASHLNKYFDHLIAKKRITLSDKMNTDWNKISNYALFIARLEKFRQNKNCKDKLLTFNFQNSKYDIQIFTIIRSILIAEDSGYEVIGFIKDKTIFKDVRVSMKYYDLKCLDQYGFISNKSNNNIWVYYGTQDNKKYVFSSY